MAMLSHSIVSNSLQAYGLTRQDFSVYGSLQARILEWVAISSTMGSSQPRDWTCVSCISCISRQILYHWATWGAPPMGHSQSITECQKCTQAGPFLGCLVFLWWAILAGGLPDKSLSTLFNCRISWRTMYNFSFLLLLGSDSHRVWSLSLLLPALFPFPFNILYFFPNTVLPCT